MFKRTWLLIISKLKSLVLSTLRLPRTTLYSRCVDHGCQLAPESYYSAIPNIKDLEERLVWDRRSELKGIDFRQDAQLAFLAALGKEFGHECDWPLSPTTDPTQFYLNNGGFSYGCAAGLHTILRHFKPRRVIEIGSGYSSRVISQALHLNASDKTSNECEYTVIDPYPGKVVKKLPQVSNFIQQRVELVDPNIFNSLGNRDILFIDTTHTVRTGGDVNFLYLDILPRLSPGVVVHIHDISLPYDYPKVYFTNPAFRVFWTEVYLLQAFLIYNSQFEILLAMNYLQTEHMDAFCAAFSKFDLKTNWANSGSFWMRRIIKNE